jgi:hypothetical protein
MPETVKEMRDQLAALTRRLARAETAEFDSRFEGLQAAVRNFAETHGGRTEWTDRHTVAVVIAEQITVEFGDDERDDTEGRLTIHATDETWSCTFHHGLPTEAALLGLIAGQLDPGTEGSPR